MAALKDKNTGTYQYKNLTIHIKREYGTTKHLSDIINALILAKFVDSNPKLVVK